MARSILVELQGGRVVRRDGEKSAGCVKFYPTEGDEPPAPVPGFCAWYAVGAALECSRLTTEADVRRRALLVREPWREYFDYRPDEMPRKGGSPVALAKLLAECGEPEPQGVDDLLSLDDLAN